MKEVMAQRTPPCKSHDVAFTPGEDYHNPRRSFPPWNDSGRAGGRGPAAIFFSADVSSPAGGRGPEREYFSPMSTLPMLRSLPPLGPRGQPFRFREFSNPFHPCRPGDMADGVSFFG